MQSIRFNWQFDAIEPDFHYFHNVWLILESLMATQSLARTLRNRNFQLVAKKLEKLVNVNDQLGNFHHLLGLNSRVYILKNFA